MPSIECNTTTAKEHVGKAERTIWTVKERICVLLAMLPFSHIPKRMKIEFIYSDSMVECISGEIGDITDRFATGAAAVLAF